MSNENTPVLFIGTEECIQETKDVLISSTIGTVEVIKELEQTFGSATYSSIKDLNGYKFLTDGLKKIKKLRTASEKKRKELTDPAFQFQKQVKNHADEIIVNPLKAIEDHLSIQIKKYEDEVQAKLDEILIERTKKLQESGYSLNAGVFYCSQVTLNSIDLPEMPEDQFNFYIEKGLDELNRIKAEQERKAKEAEDLAAERAAIEKERAEIAAERAAIAAERAKIEADKVEVDAQTAALNETYEKIETPPAVEPEPIEKTGPAVKGITVAEACETVKHITDELKNHVKPEDVEVVDGGSAELGFNIFRKQLIELASDKSIPLTRASLVEWAENAKL